MLLAQGPNAYFSITSFGWTNFCTNLATCWADSLACRHFWREIAMQASSDPGTMSRAVFVMAHTSHGATLSNTSTTFDILHSYILYSILFSPLIYVLHHTLFLLMFVYSGLWRVCWIFRLHFPPFFSLKLYILLHFFKTCVRRKWFQVAWVSSWLFKYLL